MRQRYVPVAIVSVTILLGVLGAELGASIIDRAGNLDPLLRIFFGLAIALFVGIEGLRVAGGLRQRMADSSLDFLWVMVPLIIVLMIAVYSIQVLTDDANPAGILGEAARNSWVMNDRGPSLSVLAGTSRRGIGL
jgi:uncharacterized transporter YbjL